MRKLKFTLPIILLGIFLLLSCEKEVPLAPTKPGLLETFPNSLGSRWTYHMVDNLQLIDPNKPEKRIDTVVASISDRITEPTTGAEATIWRYIINNRDVIVRPVFFSEDTVFFYWSWENRDRIGLVFPFELRDKWRTGGLLSGDETAVTGIVTFRVPAGLFENVFVLENKTRSTVPTDSRTITFWYVPNLGPIKIHLREQHGSSVGDTTWTLINHNFPGFD